MKNGNCLFVETKENVNKNSFAAAALQVKEKREN